MSIFENKPPEPVDNSWMDTYGDMVTLLLTFFILLVSISKIDANLYEQVQSGMAEKIGKQEQVRPLEAIRKDLTDVIQVYDSEQISDVGTDDRGLVVNLDAGALFVPGSAEIRPQSVKLLTEMAMTLSQPRFKDYRIEVQGHTDDIQISTPQFPSNWDLSAARALNTLRKLKELGVPDDRLLLTAYSQYAPRAPNRTAEGQPIPDNQAVNRRVTLKVYPR